MNIALKIILVSFVASNKVIFYLVLKTQKTAKSMILMIKNPYEIMAIHTNAFANRQYPQKKIQQKY